MGGCAGAHETGTSLLGATAAGRLAAHRQSGNAARPDGQFRLPAIHTFLNSTINMPNDNTLKILIQLGVIGEQDAMAVNDLVKDTESLSKHLSNSQSDAASIVKDFAKETAVAHKAFGNQGVQRESSGELFDVLSRIVPGLGASKQATFAGPAGTIILAGIAMAEMRERLKAYKERLDAVSNAEIKTPIENIAQLNSSRDSGDESEEARIVAEAKPNSAGDVRPPAKTAPTQTERCQRPQNQGSPIAREETARGRAAAAAENLGQTKAELEVDRKWNTDTVEKPQAFADSFKTGITGTDTMADQWRIISSNRSHGAAAGELEKAKAAAETEAANENAHQTRLENLEQIMGIESARDVAFKRELDVIRRQVANTTRRQQG